MPGPCVYHPMAEGTRECAGCRRFFCEDCVVELGGWTYCGNCKNAVVAASLAVVEFKQPRQALVLAIFGIFCCGFVCDPIAIVLGVQALNRIKADPRLPGRGVAIAAITIGSIMSVLYLGYFALVMFGSFASRGRHF
jgi:hypothetical protein